MQPAVRQEKARTSRAMIKEICITSLELLRQERKEVLAWGSMDVSLCNVFLGLAVQAYESMGSFVCKVLVKK